MWLFKFEILIESKCQKGFVISINEQEARTKIAKKHNIALTSCNPSFEKVMCLDEDVESDLVFDYDEFIYTIR